MSESDKPPRVVVVVSHLGRGGAERQTVELLRQLRGTEWAPVRVVCLSGQITPYGETVRALGYPLSILARAGGFDVGRWFALRRLFRRERAGVIHAVNWFASGYSVLAQSRRAQIVSSIRNSHLPAGRLRQSALPPLIRRAASVLVNSERGRQLVIRTCKVPPARIALVPNGIDVDLVRTTTLPGALRRELGIPPLSPVVLYVGRNARVKNIPRLLDVVRQLLQTNPDVHIVLAGEGLDRPLVDGTDLASASRLHCLGPRDDIPSLLHDATLLLLTSDSEGMPNVVLEALAAGVPVVATAVGDLAQILPERCGVLVPCDIEPLVAAVRRVIADAPSFARAVEQVLDTSASDAFRRGDGQRNRRGVAKRRDDAIADRLMSERMRVHILSTRTTKAFNATYPLRAFRRAIQQRGIALRIFYQPSAKVTDCDVLILAGEHWKDQLRGGTTASVLDSVRRYRDAVTTLVWLDTTDSSGTTSFEVLPYVDLYAKNQLLKDRTRYSHPFYGMRCYTDFYHQSHGIVDSREAWRVPARQEELHKLAVSWNLGLGGYVRANRQLLARLGRLQLYWPAAAYSWTRTAPDDTTSDCRRQLPRQGGLRPRDGDLPAARDLPPAGDVRPNDRVRCGL